MIKNYLIIAFRSLKRNLGFSLINIIGLATGMAAAILILFWVTDEVNYDRFHENITEIYRVYEHQTYSGTDDLLVYNTPGPLGPELKAKFANIKRVTRFTPVWRRIEISRDDDKWYDSDGYFADQEALAIFSFPFIYGFPDNALTQPNSIILNQEEAKKYFGDENPIGKSLSFNKIHDYTVTGVVERPKNTHLKFSFIIPFEVNIDKLWPGMNINWNNNSFFTYVQIDGNQDYKEVEAQIRTVVADNAQGNVALHLEPLTRSYLYNIWGTGSITNVRIFSAIALLVLLIACINFMNLTTARSSQRAKEVGLRKVSGSNRSQLIGQFLGESILLTVMALLVAIGLVALFLPGFNDLSGKEISFSSISAYMIGSILLVTFITGLVSGSYPAFFLSSFRPIKVLKGEFSKGSKRFRTVLVVFQFTLSVALIVSTMLVSKQLNYMINKNLGFQKDNIVMVNFSEGGREKFDLVKDELNKLPGVESVTCSNAMPNQIGSSTSGVSWEGANPEENALFSTIIVHYDFIEVFGMKLAEGRSWDKQFASDSMAMIVNEEAVRVMGFDNAVGQVVSAWGYNFEIIGVVSNFNFQSLKSKVEPLLMFMTVPWQNTVSIRLKPNSIANTMKDVESVWSEVYPDDMFSYRFFDQEFDKMYRAEMRMVKLFSYFSFLAILISCLGLFGLATFMAEQRYREIGIRKTMGASALTIVGLMVWEFVKWVLVANLAGWLLAFYAMEYWLSNYAYRIDINPSFFLIAGLLSVLIAVITVSYQAFKASRANPIEALKYE
ncbi:MAG: ABC transporter permease [Tenuifilaceae bacterium]|jgi:ABC-type antimicrobial peptide transport system permease subunit|nr:ABC transporter permease [Tenuifilaceae bacterium]